MPTHWRLSAWYFFYFAFIGAFAPYFTLYLQSLGFAARDIGLLMAAGPVMRMLAPAFWGWLSDRSGRRSPIVRQSAALTSAAFIVFFVADGFWPLLAGIALTFFFWTAAHPLVEALTLDHLRGRPEQYGRIRLWGSVGFVVSVLGVGVLLDMAPLDLLLWVCFGLLLGVLACALSLRDSGMVAAGHPVPSLRLGLRRPEVVALLAACFFMSAAHGALYVFFSIYLVGHGYSKSLVGMLWTLGVLAEIVVFMYMPRLLGAFSLRAILLFSFGCAVARFLMIGWGIEWLWMIVPAQLLHAASFGANHATSIAAVNRWFTGRHQARGQALYGSISFGAGGMLGGIISGWAWDAIGAPLTYSLGSAFALAGMVIIWRGWRTSSGMPVR